MVIVHPLQLIWVCSSFWIAGRAVATMVWSIEAMNSPMDTMAKIRFRRTDGEPGASGTAATEDVAVTSLTYDYGSCLPISKQAPLGQHVPSWYPRRRHGRRTGGAVAGRHLEARASAQRHLHRRGADPDPGLGAGPGPAPRPAGPGRAGRPGGPEPAHAVPRGPGSG